MRHLSSTTLASALWLMAAGDVAAYLLGSAIEHEFGFLALYFLFFVDQRVTKPKSVEPAALLIFAPQIRRGRLVRWLR